MYIYILNIALIGMYSYIYNFTGKKDNIKKFFICISIIQLILLQTLKNVNLGNDMQNYWKYFSQQLQVSFLDLDFSRYEIGFKLLTKVITTITVNKQIYLFVISSIATIPVGILAYKYSKMPFLTLALYLGLGFYNFNFSGLRQALAFGMVLYSYKYISQKSVVKYLIAIVIAMSFHLSAVVFLPAYFLKNVQIKKGRIVEIALLNIIIFIFKKPIFAFCNNFFYEDYGIVESNSYLWMMMCILIVVFCIIFYKSVMKKNSNANLLYIICIIGTSLMLFAPVANNVMRIANYYFLFIILLIPEVLSTIKSASSRYLINSMVGIFSVLIYMYLLNVDNFNIVPYEFFW